MAWTHAAFKEKVMQHYREEGRHSLSWRKNTTPYSVLVSEIMLQQTQVERVIPYYEAWMAHFPTWEKLARARQRTVLKLWSGLGYNQRALRLQKTASLVYRDYEGILPKKYDALRKLPGIGPYTAGAIMNFAFKQWTPFIDTNIRRVFMYHFFQNRDAVSDAEILKKVERVGYAENPRVWGYALMDYGSFLKKELKENPNKQSKHYHKQSSFVGSQRQLRGEIVKFLLKHSKGVTEEELKEKFVREGNTWSETSLQAVLQKLLKEQIVRKNDKGHYFV